MLKALIDAGLEPDIVAGTSIGAVAGACYVTGRLQALEDFAATLTRRRVFGFLDFNFAGSGLITGQRLSSRLENHLQDVTIERLERKFVAVATELGTGHEVWLNKGSLVNALQASFALPGIFRPIPARTPAVADTPNSRPTFQQWGEVEPFGIRNVAQFRASTADGLDIAIDQYARDYAEVKRIGALNAAAADRSLEQTETVAFWAVHAPAWSVIARNIAIARNLDAHDPTRGEEVADAAQRRHGIAHVFENVVEHDAIEGAQVELRLLERGVLHREAEPFADVAHHLSCHVDAFRPPAAGARRPGPRRR